MLGRSEEDIKILGNNTLMLNYHTHAWNKTIQGKQAVQSGMLLWIMLLLYTTDAISGTAPVALYRNSFLMFIACTKAAWLIANKPQSKEIPATAMMSKPILNCCLAPAFVST